MLRHVQTSLFSLGPEAVGIITFLALSVVLLIYSALSRWKVAPLRISVIVGALGLALALGIPLVQQSAWQSGPQVFVLIALAIGVAVAAAISTSNLLIWMLFSAQCFVAWLLLWFNLAFQKSSLF